jgi:hypothetical protein
MRNASLATSDWWRDVEDEILRCFDGREAIPPADIARSLGVSEEATISLLTMLAREGRVKICLVSRAVPG